MCPLFPPDARASVAIDSCDFAVASSGAPTSFEQFCHRFLAATLLLGFEAPIFLTTQRIAGWYYLAIVSPTVTPMVSLLMLIRLFQQITSCSCAPYNITSTSGSVLKQPDKHELAFGSIFERTELGDFIDSCSF